MHNNKLNLTKHIFQFYLYELKLLIHYFIMQYNPLQQKLKAEIYIKQNCYDTV